MRRIVVALVIMDGDLSELTDALIAEHQAELLAALATTA